MIQSKYMNHNSSNWFEDETMYQRQKNRWWDVWRLNPVSLMRHLMVSNRRGNPAYSLVEKIWDMVLACGLVICFGMIVFVALQLENIDTSTQNLDGLPSAVSQSRQSLVQIQRKISNQELTSIQQNALNRTTNSQLEIVLESAIPTDAWEPLGWGVIVSDTQIATAKQLTIFGGEFRILTHDGRSIDAQVQRVHPYDDLALFELSQHVEAPAMAMASSPSVGQKVWAFSGTHFIADGFSTGYIHSVGSNYSALMNMSVADATRPKPLQQALDISNGTPFFEDAFADQFLSPGQHLLHTAPIMTGAVGTAIINQSGELVALHSVSLSEPDSSVFVATQSVDFDAELQQGQSLSDISLRGIKPGSGFTFQAGVTSASLSQFVLADDNLATLSINGLDLNPVLMGLAGASDASFGLYVTDAATDYALQPGMIITAVDEQQLSATTSFGQAFQQATAGQDTVTFTVLQKNIADEYEQATVTVQVEYRSW